MSYRIGGCPRCGGDQYREPDTGEWACILCGYRPVIVPLVYQEYSERVGRGLLNARVEALGVGVQCRREGPLGVDTQARSRYYDANRAEMEEEYARICAMRDRDPTLPGRRLAAEALTEFHEYYGLDSARWSKLKARWARPIMV